MEPREQLIQARNTLQKAVDSALEALPEYRALQAIEQAIAELEKGSRREREAPTGEESQQSYTALAIAALKNAGHPLSTPQIIEFISRFRVLSHDPERAKINISSALSKDVRLRSVGWTTGRAWWLAGEKLPTLREVDSKLPQE